MKHLVIYHSSCADGAGAAIAAHVGLAKRKEDALFYAAQYGEDFPWEMLAQTNGNVYVLDFSYSLEITEKVRDFINPKPSKHLGNTDHDRYDPSKPPPRMVILCDHHKTAIEKLYGIKGVFTHFNIERSGAVLAWQHFFPNDGAEPEMLLYLEDRDLWRWKLPKSLEISSALRSWGGLNDFKLWLPIFEEWHEATCTFGGSSTWKRKLEVEGPTVLRMEDSMARAIAANAEIVAFSHPATDEPIVVLATNSSVLQSEVGNDLAKRAPNTIPMGIVYFWSGEQKQWVVSLRSINGYDCGALAKCWPGGGGHVAAAGFECKELPWKEEWRP
ncbi:MAG: hypothetical protein A2Y38_17355 [Spirochaetes bacterium GWB1_59_5]|nr:MAG: hypothetical protein A2Y38_17355 [Spirochaetes bacterium GWB1_59_5]